MGITSNIQNRIRRWFSGDKTARVDELKRGADLENRNFSSVYSGVSGYADLSNSLRMGESMLQRMVDYEEMDDYPEIGSALDIYADDGTIPDHHHNKSVWPTAEDKVVRVILEDLLEKRLRIEEDVYSITRTVAKYGNAYAEILADDQGVVGLNYLPPPTMRRIETKKGILLGFLQDTQGNFAVNTQEFEGYLRNEKETPEGCVVFHPWEIVHWRLQGKDPQSVYGHSVLDSARWIWRRLVMAEDSALVYKLTRAPARFAFFVEVGDLPPAQAVSYVNQVKNQYKKKKLFSQSTGKLDFKYNPLSPDEDFWVPTRAGQDSTRIEVISGPDYQAVEDLEYFRGKLFSALKVPRSYLGFNDGESKASLAQEDARFARTVMRIQREIRNGLKTVCRMHLAALNVDPDQIKFDVKMTQPSSIFEMSQIELMNARADAAERLSNYFPQEWVLENVFEFSKDDALYVRQAKENQEQEKMLNDARTQQRIADEYPDASVEEKVTEREGEEGAGGETETEFKVGNQESIDRRMKAMSKRLDALVEKNKDLLDKSAKAVQRLDEIAPLVKETRRELRLARNRKTG